MTQTFRLPPPALLLTLAVLIGACAPAASSPPGSPLPTGSPGPSPSPTEGAGIPHPTGASEVILRFEEGGGFVPRDFFVTQAPSFSLCGDGTVIFRDPNAAQPEPVGNVFRASQFRTVRLPEARVQELLEFALGPGGLALAKGPYMGSGADLPTATFTISVRGGTKSVSVTGLGMDWQGADAVIVAALAQLGERLRAFPTTTSGAAAWTPERYRGVLEVVEGAIGQPVAWPWPALKPGDFVQPSDQNGPFFPLRTMTPAEVAALGIPNVEGGMSGLLLEGPDGKIYTFGLRPLLPDEAR